MPLKDFDKFISESAEFMTENAATVEPTQVDWIGVGKEYVKTDEDKKKIEKKIKGLKWMDIPAAGEPALSVGMMPGMGIKTFIKEFKVPKVDKVAIADRGFELSVEKGASYGFYGIQGNYTNGRVRIYVLDAGNVMIPIVSEIFPKEEKTNIKND